MKYTLITLVAAALLLASYNCMAQRRGVTMKRLVPAQAVPEAVRETVKEAIPEAVPAAVPEKVKAVAEKVEKAAAVASETAKPADAAKPAETVSVKAYPGSSDQWKDSQDVEWMAKERASHVIAPHFNNKAVLKGEQHDGHTYGSYTEADLRLWQAETERLVLEGSRIFHSADLLGSTNGTSCDMCHPDAQITHPETYPKYQVQLGRAALLRDMINWCLENPCRAEPMSGDDPRMRAMEAYIQAQASGKPMKYGKH